jgi:hypothetical protein
MRETGAKRVDRSGPPVCYLRLASGIIAVVRNNSITTDFLQEARNNIRYSHPVLILMISSRACFLQHFSPALSSGPVHALPRRWPKRYRQQCVDQIGHWQARSADPVLANVRLPLHCRVTVVKHGRTQKSVVAIACGVSDGLELGCNTRAAMISQSLDGIARISVAKGGYPCSVWRV